MVEWRHRLVLCAYLAAGKVPANRTIEPVNIHRRRQRRKKTDSSHPNEGRVTGLRLRIPLLPSFGFIRCLRFGSIGFRSFDSSSKQPETQLSPKFIQLREQDLAFTR